MSTTSPQEPPPVPLDEVMLAMDVVDVLRHKRAQVEAELDHDRREQQLIARVKAIYESQGMDVPEEVIAEGVKALVEDRFTYEPPARNLAVRLAELYVERGKWLLRSALLAVLVLGVWAAVAVPAHYRRLGQVEDFRSRWTDLGQRAVALYERAEHLTDRVKGTGREGDSPAIAEILADAERDLLASRGSLDRLRSELEPGPDPETYPDQRVRLDGEVSEYRDILGRVAAALGSVDGKLESIGDLRGRRAQIEAVLLRLAGVPLSDAERRQLEARQAAILARLDGGDADGAFADYQVMRVEVERIVRAHGERESRLRQLERLSSRLSGVELNGATRDELSGLQARAREAIGGNDDAAADRELTGLAALVELLDREYELRIVARRGVQSGIERTPPGRGRPNHYIVVEAIGPRGEPLSLRLKNEEDGRVQRVSTFAVRVPRSVYEAVRQDKRDNGIIDRRRFGVKRRGAREPEYFFEVAGGVITRW